MHPNFLVNANIQFSSPTHLPFSVNVGKAIRCDGLNLFEKKVWVIAWQQVWIPLTVELKGS